MASLKELVSQVVHNVNEPFNQMLKERVKSLFIVLRSSYVRRKLEQYGTEDSLLTKYRVELIKVPEVEDCGMQGDCYILRSKNKIPKPIYYRSDTPFVNVSSLDGKMVSIRTRLTESKHQKFARYIYNVITYDYRDGYLYIYNNLNLKYLRIDTPFVDYVYRDDCDNGECIDENTEFMLDEDMIVSIKNDIYKELGYKSPDDVNVPVTEDNNGRN